MPDPSRATEAGAAESVNLLGLDRDGLRLWCQSIGQKPFRATQLMRWVHRHCVGDFAEMTNLARDFRARLEVLARVEPPPLLSAHDSADGSRKWLFGVGQGNAVEAVYIPQEGRGTLCLSTQAGCAMGCLFCSTGQQGFNRNLTTAEIVGQLWTVERALRREAGVTDPNDRMVTNVVLMGMGEPLQNLGAVIPALRIFLDDNGYGLSRRRVTVSTCGLTRQMDKLAEAAPVALAVSLHAPDDALRDQLMPVNRKHPLSELMAACRRYLRVAPRDFITFEYLLIDRVNDAPEQAQRLLELTRDLPCKFNLIPYNSFPESPWRAPRPERVREFAQILSDAGVVTTVRRARGDDIAAACGQLAGRVSDRTRRAVPLSESRLATAKRLLAERPGQGGRP